MLPKNEFDFFQRGSGALPMRTPNINTRKKFENLKPYDLADRFGSSNFEYQQPFGVLRALITSFVWLKKVRGGNRSETSSGVFVEIVSSFEVGCSVSKACTWKTFHSQPC